MPKTTVHGGASYEPGTPEPDAGTEVRESADVSRETEAPRQANVAKPEPVASGADAEGMKLTEDASPRPVDEQAEPVPTGNIQDVLNWVGDDQDRARRALTAERASDSPRTTLVAELERRAA